MNGLVRKYYYERLEKLEDIKATKLEALELIEAEIENLRDELAAEELDQQHREYERSV